MAPKKKRVVEKEMESLENEDSEADDEEDMEELGDESDEDAIGQVNMSVDVNFSRQVDHKAHHQLSFHIFTARKLSFLRLCFHRCLCVHSGVAGRRAWQGVACVVGGRTWHAHPPPADTTRYGQSAGSTHPTEMHSCY